MYTVNYYFFPHGSPARPLFLEHLGHLGLHRVEGGRDMVRPQGMVFGALYPLEQYRMSVRGERIFDWIEHTSSHGHRGYYLSLPEGIAPLPLYVKPARELSRTARAIAWISDQPGRTQSAAALEFNISQPAISAALCRLRR